MKIRFWLESGANIHSCDEEKYQEAVEYWGSQGYPEIGYEEIGATED